MESTLITAFIVGLLGGVHCLGMCGGVVGALTFNLTPKAQTSWWRMMPYQLGYNAGRILSYSLAGVSFGFLGMALGSLTTLLPIQQVLQFFSGVLMVLLGLYLGGWWFGIVAIERVGQSVWQYLQPYAKRLTPVNTLPKTIAYGFVWGWLPCGLVYSMLIMAMTAGSALDGGLVMLAFGLGTLPNLLFMGVFAFYFTRLARSVFVKRIAGASVLGMGCWQIYLSLTVTVN